MNLQSKANTDGKWRGWSRLQNSHCAFPSPTAGQRKLGTWKLNCAKGFGLSASIKVWCGWRILYHPYSGQHIARGLRVPHRSESYLTWKSSTFHWEILSKNQAIPSLFCKSDLVHLNEGMVKKKSSFSSSCSFWITEPRRLLISKCAGAGFLLIMLLLIQTVTSL